jgi:hypothetical protein
MRYLIVLIFVSALTAGCKQSDPEDNLGRNGDVVNFSGYFWDVKYANYQMGPGPNYFSGLYEDVFVDHLGYLHLRISERDGVWYSTEVITQENFGYGKYIFTVQGDLVNIPENTVLGLFTWSNESFLTQANSEVDIEFAKWGNPEASTLHYSVQPVNFGPYYPERSNAAPVNPNALIGVSTHMFDWTDTLITWSSYAGAHVDPTKQIAGWSFDLDNPARIKYENGQASAPIVIPAPDEHTNARINYWILPHVSLQPTDGQEHEIVIQRFEYIPSL